MTICHTDTAALKKCTIFRGLDEARLEYALNFFEAEKKSHPKGSFLNKLYSPLDRFGLVLSGNVRVLRDDVAGHHMILANVSPGETFGESLCFLRREADVYIFAAAESEVLWMKTSSLHNPARICEPDGILLSNRFTAMLAERALGMNERIQILSQLTIRGKLNAFFAHYASHSPSSSFEVPFDRSSMAFYLGTDRSALSRELCRMRDEGLITFSGNRFSLLSR